MKFTEFSLCESLLQGINEAGYIESTPVQEKAILSSIEKRDLYVQSQTGTGKTAAFLISIINQMLGEKRDTQALIMVPTRELAVQVEEECKKLCKYTELKCASFFGGVGYDKQVAALKKGVDILIGTPGRVIDLNEGNQMKLDNIGFLVIDEADRMFDMGFYPELRTLIKVLPSSEKRQTMLFSATLNSYVKNLAWEYTRDPVEITIEAQNITVDEIDQMLYHVSSADKIRLLLGLIKKENPESLIIFCNTKKTCEIIAKRLVINGIEAEYIIGDLPQKKRQAIMNKFKAGTIKCLVATDVAARGIDVNDLEMVINYDIPNESENYVHRIGRTARAGKSGKAFTLCTEQDVYSLPAIERYIEKQIPSTVAFEEDMADDKSKDVYIKLDSYRESYDDKSEYGKKKQRDFESRNGSRQNSRNRSGKGNGRYSSKNEKQKSEYKRDRRVFSAEEENMLASMSSDERMKLYKERYGGGKKADAVSKNGAVQKKSSKVSSKVSTKTANKNSKVPVKQNHKSAPVKESKLSLFGKIKRLFKK